MINNPVNTPVNAASVDIQDQVNSVTTIYDATWWQIIWRNMLAGASRAIGSLIIYLVIVGGIGYFVVSAFWSQAQPIFNRSLNILEQGPAYGIPNSINQNTQNNVDQLLNQLYGGQ